MFLWIRLLMTYRNGKKRLKRLDNDYTKRRSATDNTIMYAERDVFIPAYVNRTALAEVLIHCY